MVQDITPSLDRGVQRISSYDSGGFDLSLEGRHEGGLLICAQKTAFWEHSKTPLCEDAIKEIEIFLEESKIELLFVGVGEKFFFVKSPKRLEMKTRLGVSIDFMDTPAACRVYNLLLSEGRRIGAALSPL